MYTLFRLQVRRSVGSQLHGHNLDFHKNGSFQRLHKPHLRAQSQASVLSIRSASANAVQAREPVEDEDIENGFADLQALVEKATEPSDRTACSLNTSFEDLEIWRTPLERPKTARELFLDYWKSPESAKPTDLSYWNVLKGEIEGKFPKASAFQTHAFRFESHHRPDRALTVLFIFEYYDQIFTSKGLSDEAASSLRSVIGVGNALEAHERIVDLLHYSWVLIAESHELVPRFIALARYRESNNRAPLPLWLLLQVLRTPSIDRASLMQLIEWISPRIHSWNWKGSSAMILAVRLIRHIRRVPVPDFEAATACFLSALKLTFSEELPTHLPLMTLWCNRLLSLLAVPAMETPFRAVKSQQAAQLDTLQFMQDYSPEIHLGREGYRALAKVQLMHAKTEAERQWAEAKTLMWPPWEERKRMGAVRAPSHYEGQETRALKVLGRMVESGYAPSRAEASMKILAGWDTDKSPTIQTSRVLSSTSRSWEPGPKLDESIADSEIWSSRIEATRTVREAWMIFCTYMDSTQPKSRPQYVYHAMHKKLIAPKIDSISKSSLLPGDGPEVFSDPELARDQVYIPQPIPTVSNFVARIIENKIECNPGILAHFLKHETILATGLALLENCSMKPEIRDILTRPHTASVTEMADALNGLKNEKLKIAYVRLITRPNTPKSEQPQEFQAMPKANGSTFIQQCLLQSKNRDVRPWNAYLTGLTAHLGADAKGYHRIYFSKVLGMIEDTLEHISQKTTPTSATLGVVLYAALAHDIPIERVKHLFIAVISGPSRNSSVNSWVDFCKNWNGKIRNSSLSGDDIEDMVWLLGSQASEMSSTEILALLELLCARRGQIFDAGVRISRHNLAAFRLFLEANWLRCGFGEGKSLTLSSNQFQQAHTMLCAMSECGDYPDDEYMLQYLDYTVHKRHRAQTKVAKERAKLGLKVQYVDVDDPVQKILATQSI